MSLTSLERPVPTLADSDARPLPTTGGRARGRREHGVRGGGRRPRLGVRNAARPQAPRRPRHRARAAGPLRAFARDSLPCAWQFTHVHCNV